MQPDAKAARTSFFDDDDLTIEFVFKKAEKPFPKDLDSPPIIRETLTKHYFGGNAAPTQASFALHNKTLVYYKNANSKVPEMYLDLAHSRLKEAVPIGNSTIQGFALSKNGSTFEFHSNDQRVIDDWMMVLKNVCVLGTFHEEYKALKMIGRGSFAKVYLVESKSNGKMYAVKAFTKESVIISNKNNAKPSMLNEIELMRVLDHDNIIKLYEVYETEKSIYLVMELIQGKSLQDILKRSSFKDDYSEARIMKMIFSILDALAYLASKGIMHRDLKPDNILVDKGDKIKIVDFGLATYIDLPEYIFKKCGTPGYIAPEVFKYDPKVPATFYDHRCDVFSAGGIFYYMLFFAPFFEGANASEILRLNRKFTLDVDIIANIKLEHKNPNGKVNKEALNLLLQMVDFDSKKRSAAGQAIGHNYFTPLLNGEHGFGDDHSPLSGSPSRVSYNLDVLSLTKRESTTTPGGNANRYAEKESLYLDMGKPDFNGRVDTMNNGSVNNNSILFQRMDSNGSVNSRDNSMSTVKGGNSQDRKSRSKSFKAHNNSTFLKAAIFRNMQKNEQMQEESKEEVRGKDRRRATEVIALGGSESPTFGSQINHSQTNSPSYRRHNSNSSSEGESTSEIGVESVPVKVHVQRIKENTPTMRPSRNAHSPTRSVASSTGTGGNKRK